MCSLSVPLQQSVGSMMPGLSCVVAWLLFLLAFHAAKPSLAKRTEDLYNLHELSLIATTAARRTTEMPDRFDRSNRKPPPPQSHSFSSQTEDHAKLMRKAPIYILSGKGSAMLEQCTSTIQEALSPLPTSCLPIHENLCKRIEWASKVVTDGQKDAWEASSTFAEGKSKVVTGLRQALAFTSSGTEEPAHPSRDAPAGPPPSDVTFPKRKQKHENSQKIPMYAPSRKENTASEKCASAIREALLSLPSDCDPIHESMCKRVGWAARILEDDRKFSWEAISGFQNNVLASSSSQHNPVRIGAASSATSLHAAPDKSLCSHLMLFWCLMVLGVILHLCMRAIVARVIAYANLLNGEREQHPAPHHLQQRQRH